MRLTVPRSQRALTIDTISASISPPASPSTSSPSTSPSLTPPLAHSSDVLISYGEKPPPPCPDFPFSFGARVGLGDFLSSLIGAEVHLVGMAKRGVLLGVSEETHCVQGSQQTEVKWAEAVELCDASLREKLRSSLKASLHARANASPPSDEEALTLSYSAGTQAS
ncbi:MAG: hypothetical protein SGPRY_011693 [Prymnesium sp.]